jgi:hypothetical protein
MVLRLLAILTAALLIAGCGTQFNNTRKITLRQTIPDEGVKQVVLTDASAVRQMVDAISLVPKLPCDCKHLDAAVFETPTGTIHVSLCDHCFDYNGITYHMPPDFFMLYLSYMATAPLTPASAPAPRPAPATSPGK